MPERKFSVNSLMAGQRADRFLTDAGVWPSRSFVQKLFAASSVTVKGKIIKPGYRVELGDELEVVWEEPQPMMVSAEEIPLEILYEDHDLIVVNKPRGMVVHPAAGNYSGTLVNALLQHCTDLSGIGGVIRPGIVHRLDKDTSGVLVVAKNDYSHLELAKQIKFHKMNRVYRAIVHGHPPQSGQINAPIGRHPIERKKMTVIPSGRPSITHFQVLDYIGAYTYLEARLETGRTHQIRVHLSFLGYPLVGDSVYGYKREPVPIQGQALHAASLGFTHPRTAQYLEFHSDIPEVMHQALNWCQKKEGGLIFSASREESRVTNTGTGQIQ